MKRLIVLFLALSILFVGCSATGPTQEEFDKLQQENTQLKEENERLQSELLAQEEIWGSLFDLDELHGFPSEALIFLSEINSSIDDILDIEEYFLPFSTEDEISYAVAYNWECIMLLYPEADGIGAAMVSFKTGISSDTISTVATSLAASLDSSIGSYSAAESLISPALESLELEAREYPNDTRIKSLNAELVLTVLHEPEEEMDISILLATTGFIDEEMESDPLRTPDVNEKLPSSGEPGSRKNPLPAHQTINARYLEYAYNNTVLDIDLEITDIVRGEASKKIALEAHDTNEIPDEKDLIMVKVRCKLNEYFSDDDDDLDFYASDMYFTFYNGDYSEINDRPNIWGVEQLATTLYAEGEAEGWIFGLVESDDQAPYLLFDNIIWFAL